MLRKPDSIPSTDTVIQDAAMEPFFISKSSTGGFTVYERVIKGDNSTPYIKTICYPSNFQNALKKVAEEKLNVKKSYNSIKEYVNTYNSITKEMTDILS
jgi:hypothetical protein